MSAGKCITSSHTNDCHEDVTGALSNRCSGRNNCTMYVGLIDRDVAPCPKDLKSYLQASYECVEGRVLTETCIGLVASLTEID